MRQTLKLSCANGMNWGEKWDKATNFVWLYKWAESDILELCFCILGSVKLGRSKTMFPFNTIKRSQGISVTYKTMNKCSTEQLHNACNILTCIQHTLQNQLPPFTPGQNKVRLYEPEHSFVVIVEQTAQLDWDTDSVFASRCDMPSASFHVSREVPHSARCLACYKACGYYKHGVTFQKSIQEL